MNARQVEAATLETGQLDLELMTQEEEIEVLLTREFRLINSPKLSDSIHQILFSGLDALLTDHNALNESTPCVHHWLDEETSELGALYTKKSPLKVQIRKLTELLRDSCKLAIPPPVKHLFSFCTLDDFPG